MRSLGWILGSLVLALSLQTLFAQTPESQTSRLDRAKASGFDFARISDLERGDKSPNQSLKGLQTAKALLELQSAHPQDSLTPNGDVCYTMRVYYFKREGTEAPQMTGSTTCTPKRSMLKDASGKGRYVPQ